MLHISHRIPSQSFAELPSEEEIMEFLRYLGHSHEIRHLTDVNVNKLYQLWRSFTLVINKCLTGKSSGIDSFRLSQAQILWGFYHRSNVDYAYLIWEDFVYQTTQQYGAILPIELTTDDIRNSNAYKEYYACATREPAPKPKASARKKKGDSASSTTPPTLTPTTTVVSAPRLSATAKELSWNSSDDEDVDEQTKDREESEGDKSDESDDGSDDDNDETVKAGSDKDDDDNDDEEELAEKDDEDTESDRGGDEQPINYNRHALWGVSHWGRKRQQFYGYAVNRESALDVYSKRRIIAVTELKIVEWHDYKHLDWILVRRDDDQIYKFKERDFKRLRLQDIEDMLLLLEHCHPEASGRSSTGSGKLPEEAQPYEARHVSNRYKAP
nr:hypothetical protein [Tanacetum cinerariifolium]